MCDPATDPLERVYRSALIGLTFFDLSLFPKGLKLLGDNLRKSMRN